MTQTYRAVGLMSGSSLDGLDVVCAEFVECDGVWAYEIIAADCLPYDGAWTTKLGSATQLQARDYLLLHTAYGHYLGACVNDFIARHSLADITLIASHGHTVFHAPQHKMTAQLGDGAAIAAVTGIDTVSDLRALDVAHGGQGAPIVPLGEKLLWPDASWFLNIGGIANIAAHQDGCTIAFDICPANRVLNDLAQQVGEDYDAGGVLARQGRVHDPLLQALNALDYYAQPWPKSLDNGFGVDVVLPLIASYHLSAPDALATMVAHIAQQTAQAIRHMTGKNCEPAPSSSAERGRAMLVSGGGAFNTALTDAIQSHCNTLQITLPDTQTINYKEALVMALLGILRLRGEATVLTSVTGASQPSSGGALWRGRCLNKA